MEKAGKKVNEIEIEFQDGSVKKLSEIPEGKVLGLKFDGKEKENGKGDFTSFTCKKGVVKDTTELYIERRIFQNADMTEGVCYDLTIPMTEIEFNKLPFEQRHSNYAKSIRVYMDGLKAGKGKGEITKDKLISDVNRMNVPDKVKSKLIAEIEKSMKEHGFGK